MKFFNQYLKLNINNKNIDDLLFLSIALLSKIILEKKIYTKNEYLKDFTRNVYEQEYGQYLYDARPQLYSRLIKDLIKYKNEDISKFLDIQGNLNKYLKELSTEQIEENFGEQRNNKDKRPPKSSNKEVIDDWRSIIES